MELKFINMLCSLPLTQHTHMHEGQITPFCCAHLLVIDLWLLGAQRKYTWKYQKMCACAFHVWCYVSIIHKWYALFFFLRGHRKQKIWYKQTKGISNSSYILTCIQNYHLSFFLSFKKKKKKKVYTIWRNVKYIHT